ncbi:TrmH family RNA methyltransferase [Geobacter pickeringii]|uniref:tRNA/rRNA methyltransferase SpoU type domain-containing protein n=1 Tax=Geobacter pickeringii TaxID=345632 RepID=A0A0B5BEJ1_9BACT|nr:TrmH family RNA methyltransferase [Geobacter pickeringii]AJE03579.1 hypothetical protein GPICK_09635 [Geobacter pickeringii]
MTARQPLTKEEIRAGKVSRQEFDRLPRIPVTIVLDSLKCAHNVGTILRLADALLVEKVYICGNSVQVLSKKVRQGSLGAEKWVDWEYRESATEVLKELKTLGYCIVSAEISSDSINYREAQYALPLCIVLGREDRGVSPEVLELADIVVHLPIYGMANSLNVATVASVLLYETAGRFSNNYKSPKGH